MIDYEGRRAEGRAQGGRKEKAAAGRCPRKPRIPALLDSLPVGKVQGKDRDHE